MILEERIKNLAAWGEALGNETGAGNDEKFQAAKTLAYQRNGWFDAANLDQALIGLRSMLALEKLNEWVGRYELKVEEPRSVGIVMAGNLPLVGMHDLVCVLVAGHKVVLKLSGDDETLMPAALELLKGISPEMAELVSITNGTLPKTDAVMATGSENTARYFEHYFKDRPHVIRKGRNGLAVLDGSETVEELNALGKDIFQFHGLGCRNISKLLIPADFDKQRIFEALVDYGYVIDHNKYANNYNYNRTIYLMNEDDFFDNGFLLLKPDPAMASPVATLHYETYSSNDQLLDLIKGHDGQIQCLVGHGNVPFGHSQLPELWDYADGVDTLAFLADI